MSMCRSREAWGVQVQAQASECVTKVVVRKTRASAAGHVDHRDADASVVNVEAAGSVNLGVRVVQMRAMSAAWRCVSWKHK